MAWDKAVIEAIRAEFANDPASRGYTGHTLDEQIDLLITISSSGIATPSASKYAVAS